MTIVRTLTTVLGFKFDKSGLDRFEKQISSLKSKVVLTSNTIISAFSNVVDYFSGYVEGGRIIQNLSKQANIAQEDFVALRKAAEQLSVDPKTFNEAFVRLSELLREAKRGYGEVFDLQKAANYQFNLTSFGINKDTKGAFIEIIKYLQTIEDVNDRIAAIQRIFNTQDYFGILRVVEAGADAFQNLAKQNEAYAKTVVNTIPLTEKYKQELTGLFTQIERLSSSFVGLVIGPLTSFIKVLNESLSGIELISQIFSGKGFVSTFDFVAKSFANSVFDALNLKGSNRQVNQSILDTIDFNRALNFERLNQSERRNNSYQIANNNSINIEVAKGTTEEQAHVISQEVRLTLERFQQETIREINSNNPQVE